jgi:hypothetical protein
VTRASVHSSVPNPCRTAPCRSSSSNSRRRAAVSFGGRPGTGLAANALALAPPAAAAFRHRPTDTTDTPTALATAAAFTPRPSIATASRRRCSSRAELPFGLIDDSRSGDRGSHTRGRFKLHYFFKEQ